MPKALIIGSEGQDGTLLRLLLESKGYVVWRLSRKKKNLTLSENSKHLFFDLSNSNYDIIENFITTHKPDEIYYIAAFHHSSQDNKATNLVFIENSIKVNQIGFIKILEICKSHHPSTKIIYTSSSLIFSGSNQQIQNEQTTTEPRCIYSVTKSAAMEAAKYYRESYNLFVSIGIMYNHESMYRNDAFLSKKIINETKKIINNEIKEIKIGDLSSITDWGYAPDYVDAMWHILQLPSPDVFIISSGKGHKVQDWFDILFNHLNMDWRRYVVEDPSLITRKKPVLIGDNSKLLSTNWKPKVSFEEMVLKIYNNVL